MKNTELLNTVESTVEQTKELVNTSNTNVELSEEQLHGVDGGGGIGYWIGAAIPVIMSPVSILVVSAVNSTIGGSDNTVAKTYARGLDAAGQLGSDLEDKIRN
jgi:hypothetical protein